MALHTSSLLSTAAAACLRLLAWTWRMRVTDEAGVLVRGAAALPPVVWVFWHNRLLVILYVIADLLSAAAAFLLAYYIRFESPFAGIVPVTKTQPPVWQYIYSLPVIATHQTRCVLRTAAWLAAREGRAGVRDH